MMSQALVLAKKPHIIIATPGRLLDHLENTKGFNLRALKFLVMDEADRILNMDFEVEVDKILKVCELLGLVCVIRVDFVGYSKGETHVSVFRDDDKKSEKTAEGVSTRSG